MKKWLVAALLAFSQLSEAQTDPVNVVKIMNLSCPVCRASEFQDAPIRQVVSSYGGKLVLAPVPAQGGTGAAEKVFYASRDQGDDIADAVRTSLFKGAQDMGQPFTDVSQVVVWLQSDLTNQKIDWPALIVAANAPAAESSLGRAAALAVQTGAASLPTYIVLKGTTVFATVDPETVNHGSLVSLRDAVIDSVKKANSAAGK